MSESIVIVGAGQCAGQTVDSLRRGGFEGALTLIGDEPYLPYQRPPLSKQFLSGELPLERVIMRQADYYEDKNVTLRLGVRAQRILDDALELDDGSQVPYDQLLLCTGARPRPLAVPGRELGNVFDLRSVDDVLKIRPLLKPGTRLAVVGGGFIGLEVAATAVKLGVQVSVLEAAPRLMARVLSPMLSNWFADLHTRHGVDLRTGVTVEALEGDGQVRSVRCADASLEVDIVVVGIGVLPNQELAQASGITCDDGIVVDAACRTSNPRVFAAGDCTRHPNRIYGRSLRLESVQNAVSQARVAAAALLGNEASYDELPWFWTDQYDTKLQMAGLSQEHDQVVVRGDPSSRSFSVFYLRDGALIAADVFNNAREFMACRKILPGLPRVDPERIQDVDTPVDALI